MASVTVPYDMAVKQSETLMVFMNVGIFVGLIYSCWYLSVKH